MFKLSSIYGCSVSTMILPRSIVTSILTMIFSTFAEFCLLSCMPITYDDDGLGIGLMSCLGSCLTSAYRYRSFVSGRSFKIFIYDQAKMSYTFDFRLWSICQASGSNPSGESWARIPHLFPFCSSH